MAKARKRTRSTSRQATTKARVSPIVLVGVGLAALLIVLGLIYLGSDSGSSVSSAEYDNFPSLGSDDAPVTVVEYSDFGCPHCQAYILEKSEQLIADYVDTGTVKYIVHPFHLGSPDRAMAVEAALCANDQGKFFEYQRAVYEDFNLPYTRAFLDNLAAELELDSDAYQACMANGTHSTEVENARQAAIRRGVSSTPTFFVNSQKIEGNQPYERFQQIIEQEAVIAQ